MSVCAYEGFTVQIADCGREFLFLLVAERVRVVDFVDGHVARNRVQGGSSSIVRSVLVVERFDAWASQSGQSFLCR